MTDLATRIADVKKKAEVAVCLMETEPFGKVDKWPLAYRAFQLAMSPDLFLAMAARIEELQAKADDWQTMKDELDMARANYQYLKQDTDDEIAGLRGRIEELEKALGDRVSVDQDVHS
jgi:uncharacterized membrane-anchored protein YjiN (DUF445 family)